MRNTVLLTTFGLIITIACKGCVINNNSVEDIRTKTSLKKPEKNKIPKSSPYAYLNGGEFKSPDVPESPDPLIRYRWDNPEAGDELQVYYLRPVSVIAENRENFENISSLTSQNPYVTVNGTGSIMMDFGVENAAWLEFDSNDLTGTVTMSISEYNRPAIVNAGAQNRFKTKKPVKYGNTYRLELNTELYEGVRFGWIHIDSFEKPWHISNIRLVCQAKPTNYTGAFSCSDPMLTRIWYTGAYTVKLNLLKDYFGAILIERSDRISWTGDAHIAQMASLPAFANFDFVKQNLERTAKQTNNIESYAMLWIPSLIDYYRYTGDVKMLEESIPNVEKKLSHFLEVYGKNPDLGYLGWDERIGPGFENPSCQENQRILEMLFIRSCREFAWAMGTCDKRKLQKKYDKIADEKIEELRKNLQWYKNFGLHAYADAVNAYFTNETENKYMFGREFSDKVTSLSYSPFNHYFIIRAMAGMGKFDEALASVKRCWGGQIELGATTFWEVFWPEWNGFLEKNDPVPNNQCGYTSLCHPFSSGVTTWLTEEILGIKPVEPGFDAYQITPHLGRTLTWVKGKVLSPHGTINAEFDISKGICKIESPEGTTGKIGIPKVERKINKILINGKLAWNGTYHPVRGTANATEDADFVYFTSVKPGRYDIKIFYSGTTPDFVQTHTYYDASFLSEVSGIGGNWGRVFGKDGYVLFNYNGVGEDVRNLPKYVKSITFRETDGPSKIVGAPLDVGEPKHIHFSSNTTDSRAPAQDRSNSYPRKVGAISTQNPRPCFQTMSVNISITGNQEYQVALYFVDWDKGKRELAVEMFDYETKKLIAPVRKVSDFETGSYLVYRYNKSCRFRINHIRGENAVLSAIFFD